MPAKNLATEQKQPKDVVGLTYIPSQRENKFDQSEDPALPYKAMGTFWAILIGVMITLSAVLLVSHHAHSPSQVPPNLLIEGTQAQ